MQNEGTKKNQSLRKALSILEIMADLEGPVRLQDLSATLQMSPSTVLRFLNTFKDYGYVNQEADTSFYYLTLKLADLGNRSYMHFPFQQTLRKYVKEIAYRFNEAASLCVESNMQMVYIATEDGPAHMLQTLQRIGRVAPMHATGTGKVHLLNYSDEQLEELKIKHGFPKLTGHTITNLEDLKKELSSVKTQGYAVDDEECEEGVRCLAVPVWDFSGKVVAALSLSAPLTRLDIRKTSEIILFLKEIAMRASIELGFKERK
jgi:DNA-binding IclR family transcriptional regulator